LTHILTFRNEHTREIKVISATISILICTIPKHQNIFLLLIAFFTIYLIITGNRAIKLKRNNAQQLDFLISYFMMGISIIMLSIGVFNIINGQYESILYLFFGLLGWRLAYSDLKLFKNTKLWLKSHISKMLGALIASVTAFIVAGLKINHILAWILPSVFGTFYILYWIKKMKKN